MTATMRQGPQDPPDGELIARVLAGERDAYAGLIRRHQAALYRHALGMVGDPDAAADLVQDAFVKGYASLGDCHDPTLFGHWVFRILRNRCLDYLKNRRRSEVPLQEDAVLVTTTGDPEGELERADVRRAIGMALESLPEPQREAFLLKHVEELSYDEIAELVGASVSALKMRVKRARETLQAVLTTPQTRADLPHRSEGARHGPGQADGTITEPGYE